jgi:hypothetical protein
MFCTHLERGRILPDALLFRKGGLAFTQVLVVFAERRTPAASRLD